MQIEQKFPGFLVGCHYKKGGRGVDWPIEHLEWGGDTKIVRRAENIGVKKLYCYIYNPLYPNSESFDDRYDYKKLPASLVENSEKIYGEGLIETFKYRDAGWSYIILKNFYEYPNYVPIEKVSYLHNRINNFNKRVRINKTVKQRIRLGLPLTRTECKQITKLSISKMSSQHH